MLLFVFLSYLTKHYLWINLPLDLDEIMTFEWISLTRGSKLTMKIQFYEYNEQNNYVFANDDKANVYFENQ